MSNAAVDFAAIQKQLANRPQTVAGPVGVDAPSNVVSNQSGAGKAKEKSEFYVNLTVPLPIPQEDGSVKTVGVNIGSVSIRLSPYTEGTSGDLLEARKMLHQMVLNSGYAALQPGEAGNFEDIFPLPVQLEMRRPADPNQRAANGDNAFVNAIAALLEQAAAKKKG